MTLHVTTITPSQVISVCDRLLYTPARYIELGDDRYKHFVLICDDAKAAVSFAGFAGIVSRTLDGRDLLIDDTLDWLTDIAVEGSKSFHDIDSHINQFRDSAQLHLDDLQRKYQLSAKDRQLAIQVCGWKHHTQFNCVIHNYMDRHCNPVPTRRSFTTHIRTYENERFDEGSSIFLLGQRAIALQDKDACARLNDAAATNDPKAVFDSSVALIRAAALKSPSSVGTKCSGLRLTRGDPGIQVFDDRPGAAWDTVMPNVVNSTSTISVAVRDMHGRNSTPGGS
jgi:hypothetical protein